jgi:two-component system NarL family sensor kinase
VQVRFQLSGGRRPLPLAVQAGLYRIAQEALSNVERHAWAAHALLHLETSPEAVTLSVKDDGQGFDPEHIPAGRFGLVGLNERAHLLGGQLRLESRPGRGAYLEVTVPLR